MSYARGEVYLWVWAGFWMCLTKCLLKRLLLLLPIQLWVNCSHRNSLFHCLNYNEQGSCNSASCVRNKCFVVPNRSFVNNIVACNKKNEMDVLQSHPNEHVTTWHVRFIILNGDLFVWTETERDTKYFIKNNHIKWQQDNGYC